MLENTVTLYICVSKYTKRPTHVHDRFHSPTMVTFVYLVPVSNDHKPWSE